MPELLVPVSRQPEQAERLLESIDDLHYVPGETNLTILNVFEEFEVHGEWSDIESGQFYEADELPETVTSVAGQLSDKGFTVDIHHQHGDPAEAILDLAAEVDADAIVMVARQRSPIGKVLLGSVTQGVLLDADRPIIVIPGGD